MSNGDWYYKQIELGYNYRMTDLQAVLGISQIKRLDHYVSVRHEIAKNYDLVFKDLQLTHQYQDTSCYSYYHLYFIGLKSKQKRVSYHKLVFNKLRTKGILVNLHYIPAHMQPYYKNMRFEQGDFPEAEAHYSEALTLPIYPTMTLDQQKQVVASIKEILS